MAIEENTEPAKKNEENVNVGLEQSKFPFMRPRNRNAIPMLRTKSFVVNPEVTYSIASGSIILTIGIIIGLSIPSINFNEKFDFASLENTINTPNPLEGMVVLLLQFFFGFALEGLQSGVNSNFGLEELLLPMVIGWFIGGMVAAVIYDDKGKNGPYYSSIIAISVTLGISLLIG